jgi:RHS repeat-associated protein
MKRCLASTRDADGRQVTAANAVGAYTLTYDAKGEVTNERGPFGANLTMTYDADGRRTLVQDNFAGVTTSGYDADGNLTQELFGGVGQTPLRIDFNYDADGQMLGEIRYSDLAGTTKVATTSIVYDAAGNITGQVDKTGGGTNIAAYTNIYDAANQITSEQLNGGARTTYTYDADGEVTADGTNTETYDAEGNRTNTGYTTIAGNRLSTDGTWNYTYDASGNETEKVNIATGVAWTYGYDNKNELVEAEKWSSDPNVYGTAYVEAKVDYKYDAWGNEAERDDYPTGSGSPNVTRYEVDGWNSALAGSTGNSRFNVLADLDGSNSLQTRYLHGDKIDQLLARIDSAGNAYWELTDREGSVRGVLDNTGTVKDAISYDAFGNIISETNATYRGSYAWTGREFDVESDLQYNRARWYDPATARWMSQDPLGFDAGDSNLYRYVTNTPTSARDSSGLDRYYFDSGSALGHHYVIVDTWKQDTKTGLWRKSGAIQIDFSVGFPSQKVWAKLSAGWRTFVLAGMAAHSVASIFVPVPGQVTVYADQDPTLNAARAGCMLGNGTVPLAVTGIIGISEPSIVLNTKLGNDILDKTRKTTPAQDIGVIQAIDATVKKNGGFMYHAIVGNCNDFATWVYGYNGVANLNAKRGLTPKIIESIGGELGTGNATPIGRTFNYFRGRIRPPIYK